MPKGVSVSTPARPIFFSTAQVVGPWNASAATAWVSSTMLTSNPSAERESQSSWRSWEQSR